MWYQRKFWPQSESNFPFFVPTDFQKPQASRLTKDREEKALQLTGFSKAEQVERNSNMRAQQLELVMGKAGTEGMKEVLTVVLIKAIE